MDVVMVVGGGDGLGGWAWECIREETIDGFV